MQKGVSFSDNNNNHTNEKRYYPALACGGQITVINSGNLLAIPKQISTISMHIPNLV